MCAKLIEFLQQEAATLWRTSPPLLPSSRSLVGRNRRVGEEKRRMLNSDLMGILILLVVVLAVLLVPPGPGTPLRAPLPTR